jgi:hypothetical protein
MVELQQGLTEEELAFLGHSELIAEEGSEPELSEDPSKLVPAGYRERLALGDLSW